jgi:hypothetical protein
MQASITNDIISPTAVDLLALEEIVIWDPTNWVDLVLQSSEQQRLDITGDIKMVKRYRCVRRENTLFIRLGGDLFDRIGDALTTSLTRKRIRIELSVASLERVKATGMVQINLEGWRGLEPEIRIFGPSALWGGRLPFVNN